MCQHPIHPFLALAMAQVRIEANDITLDRCQILAGVGQYHQR